LASGWLWSAVVSTPLSFFGPGEAEQKKEGCVEPQHSKAPKADYRHFNHLAASFA
jgi:hypothetical protein